MRKCLYCYKELEDTVAADYHAACTKKFYGTAVAPKLPYRLDEMEKLAKDFIDLSISVPGVQPKLSLGWMKKKISGWPD